MPLVAFAENLRGQGSGLSTRQAEGGPRAPENPTPPPTVGFRVNIDGLVQTPEVREEVGCIENTAMRHRRGRDAT